MSTPESRLRRPALAAAPGPVGAPGKVDTHARRPGSAAPIWLAMVVHIVALIVCAAADDELGAGVVTTSAAFAFLFTHAYRHSALLAYCLVLAFVAGHAITFGYVHWMYYYWTTLPRGTYHETTTWLTAALTWSAVVGAVCAHQLFDNVTPADPVEERRALVSREALVVTGVAFVAFALAQIATGTLNSRWEHDSAEGSGFGLSYVSSALQGPAVLVFFVLGLRLKGTLSNPANLLPLGIVTIVAIASGLTGGRERSLVLGLLFLAGAGSSDLGRRSMRALVLAAVIAGALFVYAVGEARNRQDFGHAAVNTRLDALTEETRGISESEQGMAQAFESVLGRGFEFSAQVVIDDSISYLNPAGFEHFERLKYLFVPKFIAPEKPAIDDGREVLIRDHGYQLGEGTSVPIPLVADTFRRGRWAWVFPVGLLIGIWLRVLTSLTFALVPPGYRLMAYCLLSLQYLRVYHATIPGFLFIATWDFGKQVATLYAISLVVRLLILLPRPRAAGRARSPSAQAR